MLSTHRKIILVPLFVVWLFAVIVAYYWGHQFGLLRPLASLLRIAWQFVVVGLVALVALGGGSLLLRILRLQFDSKAEKAIYALALGAGCMAALSFLLGFVGGLRPVVFWALTLPVAFATLFWLYRNKNPVDFRNLRRLALDGIEIFYLFIIAGVLLLGLQLALAPPIAWDGLSTHLALLQELLGAGGFMATPLASRPLAGHMLYLWGMALGGDGIPQLISYGLGLLIVAAVWSFCRQQFERRTALLATAILCSVEVFIITAAWPYTDMPVALFALLAVLALIRWQVNPAGARPWFLVAALLAVLAAHTKTNGLFLFPVLALGSLLGLWWHRHQMRGRLLDIAIAAGFGLLLCLVWLAGANAVNIGTGGDIVLAVSRTAAERGQLSGGERLLQQLMLYLTATWEMTIIGRQGAAIYDGAITPLFLILLPLLLFLARKERVVVALMLAAFVEFAAWLLFPKGYYQNRHLIMAYPLFSILAAYAISRLPELDFKQFELSAFFRLILILILGLQFVFYLVWWQQLNPMPFLLGLQSRDDYLSQHLNGGTSPGYYSMMQVINERLPDDSAVGLVQPEPRVYYCQEHCIKFPFSQSATAEQMAEAARKQGLTHILVSTKGLEYWQVFTEDDSHAHQLWLDFAAELQRFIEQYAALEHVQDDSFYLYRLDSVLSSR